MPTPPQWRAEASDAALTQQQQQQQAAPLRIPVSEQLHRRCVCCALLASLCLRLTVPLCGRLSARSGIPLRHMGLLRSLVTAAEPRRVLLVEIVGRVLKNLLRARLRDTVKATSKVQVRR